MPDSFPCLAGSGPAAVTGGAPPPEPGACPWPGTAGRTGLPLSVWPGVPGPGCPAPDPDLPPCPGAGAVPVIAAFSRPGDLVAVPGRRLRSARGGSSPHRPPRPGHRRQPRREAGRCQLRRRPGCARGHRLLRRPAGRRRSRGRDRAVRGVPAGAAARRGPRRHRRPARTGTDPGPEPRRGVRPRGRARLRPAHRPPPCCGRRRAAPPLPRPARRLAARGKARRVPASTPTCSS